MCNAESKNSRLHQILYNVIILMKKKRKNHGYEISSERKVHMDIMDDSKMYPNTYSQDCYYKQIFQPTCTNDDSYKICLNNFLFKRKLASSLSRQSHSKDPKKKEELHNCFLFLLLKITSQNLREKDSLVSYCHISMLSP